MNRKIILFLMTLLLSLTGGWAQDHIQFFGYVDVEYMDMGKMPMVMTMEDSMGMEMQKIGYMPQTSGFMFHRLNLLMRSSFIEHFTVFSNIEILHGFDTYEGIGEYALEEGWIQYSHSDLFKVKAGKFLTRFGAYNQIHNASPTNLSIRPPIHFDEMYGLSLVPSHANLEFAGKKSFGAIEADYNLFLSNGTGVDENGMDLNNTRALGVRLGVEPVQFLTIGGSFFMDTEVVESDEDMNGNGMSIDMGGGSDEQEIRVIGIDGNLELGNFKVFGEYFSKKLKESGGDMTNAQTGYFFVASYTLQDVFDPFVEYDYYFNHDDFLYENKLTRATIGLRWKPNWRTALKVEYHLHNYLEGDIDGFNMFQTGITVLF